MPLEAMTGKHPPGDMAVRVSAPQSGLRAWEDAIEASAARS